MWVRRRMAMLRRAICLAAFYGRHCQLPQSCYRGTTAPDSTAQLRALLEAAGRTFAMLRSGRRMPAGLWLGSCLSDLCDLSVLLPPQQQLGSCAARRTAAQPTNHQPRILTKTSKTRFWETPNQHRRRQRTQHADVWHGLLAHPAWLCSVTCVRGRIVHRAPFPLPAALYRPFARHSRRHFSRRRPAVCKGERQDSRLRAS